MATFKQRLIREKLETTIGTDAGCAAADAIMARNLTLRALEADYQVQDFATGTEGAQREDLYNIHAAAEYQIEAFPSGTAGSAPLYAHILQSSALTMTSDASEVVFTPTPPNDPVPSTTMQMRNGRVIQNITGCRGSMSFSAEAGQKPYFTFNRRGSYGTPAAFVQEAHNFDNWPRAITATPDNMVAFTLGGQKLCVRSFSLSDGREPRVDKYMNCGGTDISARRFTGQMTIKWPDLASKDILTMVKDVVIEPLQFVLGSGAGQMITFDAPSVQIKYSGEQDIDGDLGATLDLVFLPDQGDDEISITYS